jgi:hypothetical protein
LVDHHHASKVAKHFPFGLVGKWLGANVRRRHAAIDARRTRIVARALLTQPSYRDTARARGKWRIVRFLPARIASSIAAL